MIAVCAAEAAQTVLLSRGFVWRLYKLVRKTFQRQYASLAGWDHFIVSRCIWSVFHPAVSWDTLQVFLCYLFTSYPLFFFPSLLLLFFLWPCIGPQKTMKCTQIPDITTYIHAHTVIYQAHALHCPHSTYKLATEKKETHLTAHGNVQRGSSVSQTDSNLQHTTCTD